MRAISPEAYRRITAVALVSLVAIIVTGAAVRLTGSGLGCTDWPNCEEGRLAPAEITDAPAMIEFTNRTITGIVSVAVALAVLGSLSRRPRRRDLTLLSLGLVAGVAGQIVLGGLVVLFDLSPRLVMGHFLLSMVLVWNAVVLHHRACEPDGSPASPADDRGALLARVVAALAAVAVFTGTVVTASGPHAGDEQASRLDLEVSDVARVHGLAVIALLLALVACRRALASARSPGDPAWPASSALLVVLLAQAGIGYLQYFTGVPALLVGAHVLGASLVWIAAVRLALVAGRAVVPVPVAATAAA